MPAFPVKTAGELPSKAYAGLILGSSDAFVPGSGTYVYNGQIIASSTGRPCISATANDRKGQEPQSIGARSSVKQQGIKRIISVVPFESQLKGQPALPSPRISTVNVLPCVGSVVLASVLRVRQRQVDVGIVAVGKIAPIEVVPGQAAEASKMLFDTAFDACADQWPATIRREDIRATEKDKVVCAEGFRVGDVVRGQVISIGDQANYYLTTARNELGVLLARSELSGTLMQPINWKEFKDVESGQIEQRKVAKPF